MAERAALIIAIEEFFELAPAIPYASADAAAFHKLLPAAGYIGDKCFLLRATRTTKAVVESLLARLPRLVGSVESLLVLIISRGFSVDGRGHLACADTIREDLPGTSLALNEMLAALKKVRAKNVALLLDLEPLDCEMDHFSSGLDVVELRSIEQAFPTKTVLLASESRQRSFESAQLRHGIWRHHLLEAFQGKANSALTAEGLLSVAALQSYLEEAVPRTLRRSYETMREQSPQIYGAANASAVIADLSQVMAPSRELLDPTRMKRVLLRSESSRRVKDLSGYRKSQGLPDRVNEWARKYVNRIAAADIKADLDEVFDRIREQFGYKRKDLDVTQERDGTGIIRTPDCDYVVSLNLNAEDLTEVVWRREVSRISGLEFIRSAGFQIVFGNLVDRLVFEFVEPVDVAAFIDQLEDQPLVGVKLNVASDSDTAELLLAGFAGKIRVTTEAVIIHGQTGQASSLLEQFLVFLSKFAGLGEPRALVS